jgi:hypothetical protein
MRLLHTAPLLVLAVALLGALSVREAEAEQTSALWLPWEGGALWTYTQGPHGVGTEGIDLQPPDASGKPCEAWHSSFWITAAADGTVLAEKANTLEIDHGNGLVSGYFHIEHEQVKPGDKVAAGQKIGLPGCCPDGWGVNGCWSTAPHLHFYTTYRGFRQSIVGLNLGGWRVQEDGCLTRADQVSCPLSGRIVSNSPRQGQTSPSTPADLAVIIDTSEGPSNPGISRIETAMAVLQATRADDRVSVIEFNSAAKVLAGLRPAVAGNVMDGELVKAVSAPDAGGRTNVRLGLVTGCAELLENGQAPAKAAILISDGRHNKGKFSAAEECFSENGIPVYTFGVGAANSYLMRRVAQKTGGEFKRLTETDNLYCEFFRVRTLLSGDPPGKCTTTQVKPGSSIQLPFDIPAGQDQALLEVRWRERRTPEQAAAEGIPVTTQLVSPSGRALPNNFPGLTYVQDEDGVRYTIAYPLAGKWTLVVNANDKTPPEGVFVTFSASTIPQAPPFIDLPDEPPPYDEIPTEAPTETPAATETETPTPLETETPTPQPTDTGPGRPTRTFPATPVPTDPATETVTPDPTRTVEPEPEPTE